MARIAAGDQERCNLLLDQFAYFLAMRMEGTNILASRKLKPALVWAQFNDHDMRYLANVLFQVHSNPAGAVGGARNHKTNNRVRTKQRVRLGLDKCEKKVAIAYNSVQLKRSSSKRRSDLYAVMLSATSKEEE